MPANGFVERRTGILHTCGRPPLHLIARWASKNLGESFSDQRPWGRMMFVNPGMDLEEEVLPLVGGDALHEHPRWTPFVEFVTEREEGLGVSSDPSGFSPFRGENLPEEVGE